MKNDFHLSRHAPPPAKFSRHSTQREPWDHSPAPLQGWLSVLANWTPFAIVVAWFIWKVFG